MADVDPALVQEILDVAQRQRVPHVHHHDHTDRFWRLKYRNGLLMARSYHGKRGPKNWSDTALLLYCVLPRKVVWARRIGRTVSGTEDNIETRCSSLHRRSSASAKAADHFKPKRAIVRDQAFASSL
jgi:hypothetical protein